MSDALQIEQDQLAWEPAPGTELVEVVHHYDRPLLAVIQQEGNLFMARCVLGEMGEDSVWVYARLEAEQADTLRAGTPDEIDAVADYLVGGDFILAYTQHDRILYDTAVYVSYDESDWTERLHTAIHHVNERLQETARMFANVVPVSA